MMGAYIAGTVNMSTVDWPGKISFVVFFLGCDFRCPYCYNSKYLEFEEQFLTSLTSLKKEIKENADMIDAVVFSGGEASLQRQAILSLAQYAKRIGLLVGIETNGSQPSVIKILLEEKLLDFIGLDIKAPLTDKAIGTVTKACTWFKSCGEVIGNIEKTIGLVKDCQIEVEVRTTVVPGLISTKEELCSIAESIKYLKSKWKLQQFRPDLGEVLDDELKKIAAPNREFLEKLKEDILHNYPEQEIVIKSVD